MNNKCKKFEELFISENEKALLEHIEECEECRIEYEKMQKVSNLIKEAKPLYKRKRTARKNVIAMAASFLMVFLAFFAMQISNPESVVNETIAAISGSDYTYEQMGLPVDEYGLIMADYDY